MDWKTLLLIIGITTTAVAVVAYIAYLTWRVYSFRLANNRWPVFSKSKVAVILIVAAVLSVTFLWWWYTKVLPANLE